MDQIEAALANLVHSGLRSVVEAHGGHIDTITYVCLAGDDCPLGHMVSVATVGNRLFFGRDIDIRDSEYPTDTIAMAAGATLLTMVHAAVEEMARRRVAESTPIHDEIAVERSMSDWTGYVPRDWPTVI